MVPRSTGNKKLSSLSKSLRHMGTNTRRTNGVMKFKGRRSNFIYKRLRWMVQCNHRHRGRTRHLMRELDKVITWESNKKNVLGVILLKSLKIIPWLDFAWLLLSKIFVFCAVIIHTICVSWLIDRVEGACKLQDTVRNSFTVPCVEKRRKRSVVTGTDLTQMPLAWMHFANPYSHLVYKRMIC